MNSSDITQRNLEMLLGRTNGMLAALVTVLRTLPPAHAKRAEALLRGAEEHLTAGAVASPLPDLIVHEQERVMNECVAILKQAAADY